MPALKFSSHYDFLQASARASETDSILDRDAYHEAAHALAALSVGCTVTRLEVWRYNDATAPVKNGRHIRGRCSVDALPDNLFDDLFFTLAPAAALSVWRFITPRDGEVCFNGCGDDFAAVRKMLQAHGDPFARDIFRSENVLKAFRMARQMIANDKLMHSYLSLALFNQRTMDMHDIEEALAAYTQLYPRSAAA